ncbi:MAG: AI-2E family transporter [Candidatus Uhrbacteria bacterium]|nr:AI-2E family transporter [Candidatus Uhrbacteria bacterium]
MAQRKEERSAGTRPISISSGTFFRILFISAAAAFLYFIRDIVAMVLVAMLTAAVIDPFADFFERWRIPRALAVIIVYIFGLAALLGAWILVVPPVVAQLADFLQTFFPGFVDFNLAKYFVHDFADLTSFVDSIRSSGASDVIPKIFAAGSTAVNIIVAIFVVLILSFYFVVEKTALVRMLRFVARAEYQPFAMMLAGKVREKMGLWLRGQLLLMLSIFLLTYGALLLLQIPYALVLALLAGILEVIPFVGPLLSAVPAVILAFAVSPLHAFLTAGVYVVIQQVEGNLLVPKIMQRVTGLNPIASVLAILIGWRVGGIVGAMVSIPIAMAVSVFLEEVFRQHEED